MRQRSFHPSRRALGLVALTLASTSCYFEGSVAYHPRISQSVTSPGDPGVADVVTDDGGGWSAGANIGFYLDARLPSRSLRGFGLGLSPQSFNGYGLAPSDGVARAAARGLVVRGDVTLPIEPLTHHLHERVTVIYDWIGDGSATIAPAEDDTPTESIDGRMWFVGASVGYAMPVRNGGRSGNFLWLLSLGVERFRADIETTDARSVRVSSTGLGARLMVVPALIGSYQRTPDAPTSTSGGNSNAGCYYTDECDTDGNCRTVYKCP
jgi:hypothetical protein